MRCTSERSVNDAEFSLETFRHKLDEQGMSIAENQEQSVKSRKRLAETTRGTQEDGSFSLSRDLHDPQHIPS